MIFSHKPQGLIDSLKKDMNIYLGNTELQLVVEYLGIVLDERLLFLKHLTYLKGIIN